MVPAPTLTMDRGELGRAVKLKYEGLVIWWLWLVVLVMGKKALAQRLWELVTTMLPLSTMVA